jgi:hypothetical protein
VPVPDARIVIKWTPIASLDWADILAIEFAAIGIRGDRLRRRFVVDRDRRRGKKNAREEIGCRSFESR